MAHSYPKDRFDVVPDDLQRVGAHRAPTQKGRGWIWFAWCALATIILVGLGVLGLFLINGTINFSTSVPTGAPGTPSAVSTPTPTITPAVNPALEVTVLNGTTQEGLAGSVATTLKKAGWQNVSTANASDNDIATTVVFYSSEANKAAALAAAASLPGSTIEITQVYVGTGADITVVVGKDYRAPSS